MCNKDPWDFRAGSATGQENLICAYMCMYVCVCKGEVVGRGRKGGKEVQNPYIFCSVFLCTCTHIHCIFYAYVHGNRSHSMQFEICHSFSNICHRTAP